MLTPISQFNIFLIKLFKNLTSCKAPLQGNTSQAIKYLRLYESHKLGVLHGKSIPYGIQFYQQQKNNNH